MKTPDHEVEVAVCKCQVIGCKHGSSTRAYGWVVPVVRIVLLCDHRSAP